jgi:hypothetical protein
MNQFKAYGGHPDGEKMTLSQITIPEGWKNLNPDEGNVMCGPDGQRYVSQITIPEGWKTQNPDEGNVMCGKGKGSNPNRKRGAGRQTITLGELHKVQKAKERKAKQNLRRKLGGMEINSQKGWKKPIGPLP